MYEFDSLYVLYNIHLDDIIYDNSNRDPAFSYHNYSG